MPRSSKQLLFSGFPTKTPYAFLLSPKHATCPAHLILLDFIILIFDDTYISCSSLKCNFLQVTGTVVKVIQAMQWTAARMFTKLLPSVTVFICTFTRTKGLVLDKWCLWHIKLSVSILWDDSLQQLLSWGFRFCGMWQYVVGQVFCHVLNKGSAFLFRVTVLSLDSLTLEDKGIMLLQNVRNHIPNYMVSQAPRPELLATPL